ncbi:ParA family protein [Domibacillus tundrae]|uniref:ParA family protein n=1 Tax=Domibacillus tundrae TaxID=1587527 RepID=UPI000617BA90|nr:ParA family protein [Domibacillus tundrae]
MTVIVSFGLQKGGVGKTTTTGITAFLLAKTKRVLVVDLDGQGNLTRMLSGQNKNTFENTVYEAIKYRNTENCITVLSEKLHLIPANDDISQISTVLDINSDKRLHVLADILHPVRSYYDYILLDLPPALSEQTLIGLTASDYTVTMLQTEPFAYYALEDYLETCQVVQKKYNPNLKLAGILSVLLNSRSSLDQSILERVRTDYEDIVFESVIKRKSRLKELAITGITDKTKADRQALQEYNDFVQELVERVQEK